MKRANCPNEALSRFQINIVLTQTFILKHVKRIDCSESAFSRYNIQREKNMSNKSLLGTAIVILALIASQFILSGSNYAASAASSPTQFRISVGPTSIPADNNLYNSVFFIQLLDSKGVITRAPNDMMISLSSSRTDIGMVDSVITISKGDTYVAGRVQTTFTPGITTISATMQGYATVQATLTTVGPIPSTLVVYALPQTVPSDGGIYPAVVVQLQDTGGSPARAPIGGLTTTLSSSNVTVGTVPATTTILEGETYSIVDFTTNPIGLYYPAQCAGDTDIIAIAQGYTSRKAAIKTQVPSGTPTKIRLTVGPQQVSADNIPYDKLLAVQLIDDQNKIATTGLDLPINLASSEPDIGVVDPTCTILASQTYTLARFKSTYKAGATTITASQNALDSATASITTRGPTPTKIAVYCVPSSLPADKQTYPALKVQLQDSSGRPAIDPNGDPLTGTSVFLFSSEPDAGTATSKVIIPYGQTYTTADFFSTFVAGSTTLTAQASNYATGQATMRTYIIDPIFLNVSTSISQPSVTAGNPVAILARVTYNGTDAATGTVPVFSSNKPGNFTTPIETDGGVYTTVFTPQKSSTQISCIIVANASKTGYLSTASEVTLTVIPSETPKPSGTPTRTPTPTQTLRPTPTPSSTRTPTPSPTPASTPTLSPTATATPTPSPTLKPLPSPTQQSTPSPKPANNQLSTVLIIVGFAVAASAAGFAAFLLIKQRRLKKTKLPQNSGLPQAKN